MFILFIQASQHLRKQSTVDGVDSDDERMFTEDALPDLSRELPQASDKTTEILDQALSGLPSRWVFSERTPRRTLNSISLPVFSNPRLLVISYRWRNYVVRTLFTLVMISFFGWLIYMGPLALMVTTLAVQVKCFQEIIAVGYAVYRVHGLPWFRSISWFFLFTSNYFIFGESMVDYFAILLHRDFRSFIVHHRFISFSLYITGFLWFVLSLKKRYYMRQFSLFAWTHVTLLIVVTQSYLILQNMFEGLIWFVVPVSLIVTNDCMAYLFGFFFGKTPLIKLSPKKTWEGFIGGGIATVIIGCFISYYACQYPNLVCPITDAESTPIGGCDPPRIFKLQTYSLPTTLSILCRIVSISFLPFLIETKSCSQLTQSFLI